MTRTQKRRLWLGAGFLLGALGGWLYWRFVGCLSGHCPIWSNAWIATGYGAVLGWLILGLIPFATAKGKEENERDE